MSSDSEGMSRRSALKTIAALSVCPLVSSCEFVDHDGVEDFEVAEAAEFSLGDPGLEELGDVGGTACFELGDLEILLVRADDDEILAFERICPHNNLSMGGCDVAEAKAGTWHADEDVLECRHHGSRFDRNGEVVEGPAFDPIDAFPVEFDADEGEGTVFLPD